MSHWILFVFFMVNIRRCTRRKKRRRKSHLVKNLFLTYSFDFASFIVHFKRSVLFTIEKTDSSLLVLVKVILFSFNWKQLIFTMKWTMIIILLTFQHWDRADKFALGYRCTHDSHHMIFLYAMSPQIRNNTDQFIDRITILSLQTAHQDMRMKVIEKFISIKLFAF